MNRRAFLGAVAALVLPVGAFASRAVPNFIVDSANRCRFWFNPFGELDWIEMPSDITAIKEVGDTLEIQCVGGLYVLYEADDPALMYIRERSASRNY